MRGSPPVHLLLLALAFALVAVPLGKLTSGAGAVREVEVVRETGTAMVAARVKLRFSPGLELVALMVGERELLGGVALEESPVEVDVELPITEEGLELLLEARWTEGGGGEAALTVEIEPEGLEAREVTRWADEGSVSEVLFFQW